MRETNREGMLTKQAVMSMFTGDALANWSYLRHHIPVNGLTGCQMLVLSVLESALDDMVLGPEYHRFWLALEWIAGGNDKKLRAMGRFTAKECWEYTIGDTPSWLDAKRILLRRFNIYQFRMPWKRAKMDLRGLRVRGRPRLQAVV